MPGSDCKHLKVCSIAGASVMFAISTVCYIIALSVGWTLAKDIHPHDHLLFTAAMVITVPLYSVVVVIILGVACARAAGCTCSKKEEEEVISVASACLFVTLVLLEMLAGLFEVAGAVIFIVAAVNIGDYRVLAFGISAGVFGIFAGCSWCFCECFTAMGIIAFCHDEH